MAFIVDIVTGASQGIGRAIAEHIAFQRASKMSTSPLNNREYLCVLVGRNTERGTKAANDISRVVGGLPVLFEECDLSDFDEVKNLRSRISERVKQTNDKYENDDFDVGVLVNNAAECPRSQVLVKRKQQQKDGTVEMVTVDKQFASNVLGYHFMMHIFQDHFSDNQNTSPSSVVDLKKTHVVNVASNWAGDLDLNDVSFQRRPYDNDTAYRQSKQCDRMLSAMWSKKLEDVAVVNACHPGDPKTTLSVALGYNMWSSAPSRSMIENESPIPFLCGLGESSVETTGGWFEGRSQSPRRDSFHNHAAESERLLDLCESFCC